MTNLDSDWIIQALLTGSDTEAIVASGRSVTYKQLVVDIRCVDRILSEAGVAAGERVAVVGDFGALSTAVLIALVQRNAILIPLTKMTLGKNPTVLEVSASNWLIEVDETLEPTSLRVKRLDTSRALNTGHDFYRELLRRRTPGLILFTSGTTGEPKAVVHDFSMLLKKFRKAGKPLRTLNFLLFDHWGGLNTLFHTLMSNGVVVCPESRTPHHICGLIEKHRLELLPASPSFLNMMLLSGAHREHDLSSLCLITYGAEPMAASTLAKLNREFPSVELRQTYGLIEVGVLRAQSEARDSLLVKIGGEGYDIRVIDGLLEIKAESSMLGYLNAPSPFTSDGYFKTGDRVEVHGEYLRILGRDSEQINVGGEKVFPAEVESVLLASPLVKDAVVYGVPHPLSGKVVAVDIVRNESDLDESEARVEIRQFCNHRLESFKVPVKIRFVQGPLVNDRQKRIRINRGSENN